MTDGLHLLELLPPKSEGTFKISGSSLQADLETSNLRMKVRVTSWVTARQEVLTTYRAKDQRPHVEVTGRTKKVTADSVSEVKLHTAPPNKCHHCKMIFTKGCRAMRAGHQVITHTHSNTLMMPSNWCDLKPAPFAALTSLLHRRAAQMMLRAAAYVP